MGSGFSKMKKQARQMQEQLEKAHGELSKQEVVGSSGSGLVTLTLTGDKMIKSITIKPECIDLDDIEALQDLIIGAFNDASNKLQSSLPSMPFGF